MQIFNSKLARRTFLAGAVSFALVGPASALNTSEATALADKIVAAIAKIIASGKSQSAQARDFQKMFDRYADVPVIARFALGPASRTASKSDMARYTTAFSGYMARKYGKRFDAFHNGQIKISSARKAGKYYQVDGTAILNSGSRINVAFGVSDRSGRDLIFDIKIEGISLIKSEAVEVRALLDRNGGDIGKLAAALDKLG